MAPLLAQLGIFYSTTSGKTQEAAELLKEALGDLAAEPQDIGDVTVPDLLKYDGIFVGAPTWNTGATEQRSGTAWDEVLDDIRGTDMSKSKVAVFGLGDSVSYGDYYCDAMEELYSAFKTAGATMHGMWPTEGYLHSESEAEIEPGKFCGLALDEDNQDDLTQPRIKQWSAQVLAEMGVKVAA